MIDVETYMVCVTCLMAAAGYDEHETGEDMTRALSLIPAGVASVSPGDGDNDHDFSWSWCEGCGSHLGGSRHEVVTLTSLACSGLFGEHSDDRVSVHRGRETADLFCGRHAAEL